MLLLASETQAENAPRVEATGDGVQRTDAEKNAFAFFQKIAGKIVDFYPWIFLTLQTDHLLSCSQEPILRWMHLSCNK